MRAHIWNTRHWRRVAEIAEMLRTVSFEGASDPVVALLDKRLRRIEETAKNVDHAGSSVDALLRDTLLRELAEYTSAQRAGRGAVLLVRWPLALPARLRLAAGVTSAEWELVARSDPRRMASIRRDFFFHELFVGPSVASLLVADRLSGGVRREPSPTGGMVLPDL